MSSPRPSSPHRRPRDTHPLPVARRIAWCAAICSLAVCSPVASGPAAAAGVDPAAPSAPWDGPAFSGDPAAVLAAAAELPVPEGAEVEVLFETVVHVLDAEGLVSSTYHKVYRLIDAAALGGWWSNLDVRWSPWYQARPEVRARVIGPDGSVRELDPATVAEAAVPGRDPSLFEDTRRLRAPLPGLAVGAVVEFEIVERRLRPLFAAGENRRLVLSEYAPVRRSRFVLDLPAGLGVRFRAHELGEPSRRTADGREILTFEATGLDSFEDDEKWLPPEEPQLGPYVDWSTGRSWAEVAAAYGEIVDAALAGADVGDLLEGLGEPRADRDAWLAGLLTRLHRRVRYTGVEFDEARIVPRTPAETLARGFGDCKDKAVLLVAALRRASVPAHVALLKSGYFDSLIDPELPGLGQFDHAIVHLPGEPPTWIDATDPFSRPGELASADRGRQALVIAPGTTGLTTIPEATAADNRISIVSDVYLAETGKGRVVESAEFHGTAASRRRARYHGSDREKLEEWFTDHVENLYLSGELTSFEVTKPDDLTEPLRVRLEAEDLGLVITDSTEAAVGLRLSGLFEQVPAQLLAAADEPRRHPFAISDPYLAEWTYRVHLPPGLALRDLPDDAEDAVGPARFRRSFEIADGGRRVDVRASVELDRTRLSAEEVAAAPEAVERLDAKQGSYVLLEFDHTVNAHLAAGRLQEAIAEAQRLSALHPDEALHAGQLANALLAGSLGAEARRAARRGTELEPDAAAAWAVLGRMLLHDEVGRYLQPGYDRAGAIAALRKAAELDPEDHSVRGDLAIALEHDDEGRRFGEGADLEGAVALYRELSDDLDELGLGANLAVALLEAGRYEEMRAASEALTDEVVRNQLMVLAAALIEGPQAAVREAGRRYPEGEARATALASAGQDLLLLRRYAAAAELARTAARQSPRAADLLSFAEVLGRAVPYEQLISDQSDPKGLFVRLLALLAEAGDEDEPEEAIHRLFARVVRDESTPEDIAPLLDDLRTQISAEGNDLPPEVAVDLAAAALSASVEGDDEVGYRVRLNGGVAGGLMDKVILMVPENGVLRLVASLEEDASPIGLEALRRIDAGDLAGARRWLDWALDGAWNPGQVSDPFSAAAFPHFWSRSGEERDEPGAVRLAAAVLAAPQGRARTIEVLAAARAAETGLRQARIDAAMLRAYAAAEDADGVTTAIGRLRERIVSESERLFQLAGGALLTLGRYDETAPLAHDRLAANPDDPSSLRLLADLARETGDVARAAELYERLFDTGKELSYDYNNAAWIGLASPITTAHHLELAQRAIAIDGSHQALHTLAALLAVTGQPAEARRVLLQSIEAEGGPIDSHDLYVLGLLAETYGLPEAAARYYQRTVDEYTDEDHDSPTSTAALARARAAALRAPADHTQTAGPGG